MSLEGDSVSEERARKNQRIEPDRDSWEYQRAYALTAKLKRRGIPMPLVKVIVFLRVFVAFLERRAWLRREEK